MTIELGIIISLVSIVITAAGFIIAQKKSSKDDGMSLRYFHGRDKG